MRFRACPVLLLKKDPEGALARAAIVDDCSMLPRETCSEYLGGLSLSVSFYVRNRQARGHVIAQRGRKQHPENDTQERGATCLLQKKKTPTERRSSRPDVIKGTVCPIAAFGCLRCSWIAYHPKQ